EEKKPGVRHPSPNTEHRTPNTSYSSSRPPSSVGRRPYRSWGEYSPFRSLSAAASLPASRQSTSYFSCPLNSLLKNAEAVEPDTPASFASSLLPMGSRFRQ